jgi:Trk K+ transport system NAD-binding subunit
VANPLFIFWRRLFGDDAARRRRPGARRRIVLTSAAEATATIFLVLRRMRAPLIVLILIFAVSVLGLHLIPGTDAQGATWRMSFFDAFYFMSYTASTIGFGELPQTFNAAQRLWVTFSIYLTVIGWAYAIGTLLALFNDTSFRSAIAMHRFARKVARLREPFLLIAGYGKTGELLGRAFDNLDRRFVVVDVDEDRIESLDLEPYFADIPGLIADARDPDHLVAAGLNHDFCEGVLALTNDDEVNLAITMSAALLRPDLPVIARTVSSAIEDRMRAFGTPTVVNPFDRFGDHLRMAMRASATYRLLTWLESGPGAEQPELAAPPTIGRWIVCGYGRFGRELTGDLRAEGLEVTVIEPSPATGPDDEVHDDLVVADASEPSVMGRIGVEDAVGFVAGTDNDTTNLSLIAAARRRNPGLYVAARQNQPANAPLFAAMELDLVLVPSEVIAHEVYAQLSTPLLWRFLQEMPRLGDEWAARMMQRITQRCGHRLQPLWKIRLTPVEAPALQSWLASGCATPRDLFRDPDDRDRELEIVPLLLLRDGEVIMGPDVDVVLAPGDELLLAGQGTARRRLETTMLLDAAAAYVVSGETLHASWLWRTLADRHRPGRWGSSRRSRGSGEPRERAR